MNRDKIIAKRLFWGIYIFFLITTFFARHIFGLIFAGPLFAAIYALIIITSFIPYRLAMNQFNKAIANPEKSKKHIRLGWMAIAFSLPLKLVLIGYNYSEILSPTSSHWNFG